MSFGTSVELLTHGILWNTKVGKKSFNEIEADELKKFVQFFNDGLRHFYTKFVIETKQIIIQNIDGRTQYPLLLKHAKSFNSTDVKFIDDTDNDPFVGRIIKIIAAFNEFGYEIPINEKNDNNSVFLPKYNVIEIPQSTSNNAHMILYQANHMILTGDADEDISIPEVLKEALKYYVASSYFSSMIGEESTKKSLEYTMRYEQISQSVIEKQLLVSDIHYGENNKLNLRGWV